MERNAILYLLNSGIMGCAIVKGDSVTRRISFLWVREIKSINFLFASLRSLTNSENSSRNSLQKLVQAQSVTLKVVPKASHDIYTGEN